jgi:hypothetical protein
MCRVLVMRTTAEYISMPGSDSAVYQRWKKMLATVRRVLVIQLIAFTDSGYGIHPILLLTPKLAAITRVQYTTQVLP